MQQLTSFLPLIIIMGAFMFFGARRQRKAMQATIDLHDSLRVGDRVGTIAGMQGVIEAVGDDTVDLEIAPGVVTRWSKMAIRDRIEPEAPEAISAESRADEVSGATETLSDPDRLPKD